MKKKIFVLLCCSLSVLSFTTLPKEKRYKAIHSGTPWFDQNRKEVNAHGVCVVKEGDLYYLFGEFKTDTSNAFTGFGCYSSPDLMNWTFERVVLPVQKNGLLGPNRVGERPKVMKCPATGEFIMYMHCDDMGYYDPHIGYATCQTINGEYEFQGGILYQGEYIHKWDLGTYQDEDGKGYLLTHEGFIYELAPDYKSVERLVVSNVAPGGESPAMFKKGDTYFWLFSNKTSWERNDNYYLTASALEGPWIHKGLFAPEGSLTWNSQCSFVLPIPQETDTLFIYMGDRWSFPKQQSAATQVWQPLSIHNNQLSIPAFYDSWYINRDGFSGWEKSDEQKISIAGEIFQSNEKGKVISYSFKGRQVGIKALANNTSGYAKVTILNKEKKEIINTIVDFYCLTETPLINFISPLLPDDTYILRIEVTGEYPKWSDKKKSDYGSTDCYVTIADVFVIE